MASSIQFVFFDLGKVLLHFDFSVAAERLHALTGLDGMALMNATLAEATPVCEAVETDAMSSEELYEWVCAEFGISISRETFEAAHRDIFTPMHDSWEMVRELKEAGIRLGILSNICQVHWDFCRSEFPELFTLFDVPLSSVGLKARKPGREIYLRAAEHAGVSPEEILFFDDRPENVEGARKAGFHAELFSTAGEARKILRAYGLL